MKKLFFDIETSPNLGWTWGKWEQNVIKFVEERGMMSFSWNWEGDKHVEVLALPDFPKEYKRNPKNTRALVGELHSIMSKADIIVAHNGKKFDIRRSRTEFIKHRYAPLQPFKTIDTLKMARTLFDFNSNRLDDLGELLGVGRKVKHPGFEMWEKAMAGDMEAWAHFKRYNQGDVSLLKGVYNVMAPWENNHPNMNLDTGHQGCPTCQSIKWKRRGWSYSKSNKIQRYRCLNPSCRRSFHGREVGGELKFF